MLNVHLVGRAVHARAFMNEECQGSSVYNIISLSVLRLFKVENCPHGIHLIDSEVIV